MPIKTILAIASLIVSFVLGCWFSNEGWEKRWAEEKAARAAEVATLSEQYRSKEHELAKNAKELDQKYTRDLSMAERRIDSLESSLAAGSKRVFVRAACPNPSPAANPASGVGNGATAELGGVARQDYLHLKRGLVVQERQVRYLQDYIKQQCLLD